MITVQNAAFLPSGVFRLVLVDIRLVFKEIYHAKGQSLAKPGAQNISYLVDMSAICMLMWGDVVLNYVSSVLDKGNLKQIASQILS